MFPQGHPVLGPASGADGLSLPPDAPPGGCLPPGPPESILTKMKQMDAIRTAHAGDEAAWRGLWRGFTGFYGITLPETTTAATWARIIDPDHPMTCRLALAGGEAVGFAIHHAHASTWVPGNDVYLEDLFVAPEARGAGVARALIEDLIAIGRAKGWHRLYWNTHHDNAEARRLYDRFCADDGHIRYRMTL